MGRYKSGGYLPGIATGILMAIAIGHANTASAATITVTNCNDNGSGSLRSAVFRAASGDTIDLAHLTCSRITLTSGEIDIQQGALNLVGRSRDALTIDGGLHDRVFWHHGTGRLRLAHLSVAHGFRTLADDSREDLTVGGCIRSDGNLELYWTKIHHCTVKPGHGGAVALPFGNASISHSLILANVAIGNDEFQGSAAGLYVRGHMVIDHSRVSANQAIAGGAGGIFAGSLEMTYSLIDHNTSDGTGGVGTLGGPAIIRRSTIADNNGGGGRVGGIEIQNRDTTASSLIADSTISRNRAAGIGGVDIYGGASVVNSTIAQNQESKEGVPSCEGALAFRGTLRLESTIVALNYCAGIHSLDLAGFDSAVVVGSHNLVGKFNVPVPADTLSVPPRLGTLANNGGPTPTDALLCDSPAIDRGNNVLNHAYDQRGPGYFRVRGAHADIGAFEVQNPMTCASAGSRP